MTAELEEGARRSPADSAAGAALLCRGLVERDPDLALAAVATIPRRPRCGRTSPRAAKTPPELLAAAGRRDEAVALLHEAAAIHADIGRQLPTPTRVDAALRQLGVRRPRRRRHAAAFGWESLTPTEIDVSRLVADGLTNPEIGARLYISRRTVETHLSHVFTRSASPAAPISPPSCPSECSPQGKAAIGPDASV